MDEFLSSLGAYQVEGLVPFLKKTNLLFIEPTLSGYACQTGSLFCQLGPADIPLFVADIKNGKYDAYF